MKNRDIQPDRIVMHKFLLLFTLFFMLFFEQNSIAQSNGDSAYQSITLDNTVHVIAKSDWDVNGKGNHRAIVAVTQKGIKVVRVLLPWRRADEEPDKKRVVIIDGATGKEITNVFINHITNEEGSITFEPVTTPGNYEIYYLPYLFRKNADDARYGAPWNDYLLPNYKPDQAWLSSIKSAAELPYAKVLRFEARKREDFFTPMGLIATAEEQNKLTSNSTGDYMVFPEDRAFPIRLTDKLPVRWIAHQPERTISGVALKNEYYAFQLGVFAHKKALSDVKVSFSDLKGADQHAVISKDSLTCFNQGGTGWDGKPLLFKIDIQKGKIQALWLGLSIPKNIKAQKYEGWVTLNVGNGQEQKIKLEVQVNDESLADRGDGELWKHARLRWLNSTLGISDEPVKPYTSLRRKNKDLFAGNKRLTLNAYGLPAQISVNSNTLFSAPLSLTAETSTGHLELVPGQINFIESNGKISWKTIWTAPGLTVNCVLALEFDGSVSCQFLFSSRGNVTLQNLKLLLTYPEKEVPYLMGIGLKGGKLPALPYSWDWKGPWDSFWIGNADAGLHLEFQKGSYNGPLLNDYKPQPPFGWANGQKGTINVTRQNTNILVAANTGQHIISPDKPLELGFKLLITPVKDIDVKKHFTELYYQGDPLKVAKAASEGANVINVHHNTSINPYINYPFIERDSLKAYISKQHSAGHRVKLYYTIRELSNYATEIYALRSLGTEIFPRGPGKGSPWLWEHLNSGYKAAWYAPFPDQTADASIVMNGFSRWINYYIEGLKWMLDEYKIDGLYLDDVAYDREVIQRLRRVLLKSNPNALLDLHSNNNYSVGPANQYAAFFPYLDRLWFGESFKYNSMSPDEWLVQFSGIPFGLMSEMLQDDGNRWLGMIYGASNRHSWGSESPAALWKYWKTFNIKDAKMYGYWDKNCPVSSNNPAVKITVYEHKEKLLLAIANFSDTTQYVIPKISYPVNTSLIAPEIDGYQHAEVFKTGSAIKIDPKRGMLLEIEKNNN